MRISALRLGKEEKDALTLTPGGIEGDKPRDTTRAVSLVPTTWRTAMDNERIPKGICNVKFKENITVDGLSVKENQCYQIGSAVIRVTQVGKHCFDECPLSPPCDLQAVATFAQIEQPGTVHVGDQLVEIKEERHGNDFGCR